MEPRLFYLLVQQMRTAQKNYFATGNKFWLQQSKALERSVDLALKDELEKPTHVEGELW